MPQFARGLTCPAAGGRPRVAGFISEWWPASNRNGGRLQIGIGGRIASEFALMWLTRNRGGRIVGSGAGYPPETFWPITSARLKTL